MSGSKVILVTGASSGIGRATADLLHARGHRVFGSSRNPAIHEAPWSLVGLDVTEDASVAACVEAILASEGRIDAVVNNAGLVMAGAVEDTSPQEAQRTFETNVIGAIRVARAVLPSMRSRRSGVIVNMGSLAGRVGMPFQGLYSASKFALEGLTESLRQEVAGAASRWRSSRPAIPRHRWWRTASAPAVRPIPAPPIPPISRASWRCMKPTSGRVLLPAASRPASPTSSMDAGGRRDMSSGHCRNASWSPPATSFPVEFSAGGCPAISACAADRQRRPPTLAAVVRAGGASHWHR